ncbi:MAG: glycerate kinase [Bacteroidales bacterium]|nr:glycerate kinase [Bacteroidales bacterium]
MARTISSALGEIFPGAEIVEMPLADGGEGTVDVVTRALGGEIHSARVCGPICTPVDAQFGIAGDTAVIEVAQACGLQLLEASERNPLNTTSRGVGELLLAAREQGCRNFIIGLGGTATCDGGAGMLSVPGLREAMAGASIELLCDVDNPFLGSRGAARVFAPQKGASPSDVEVLERRMADMSARILHDTGVDVSDVPGAGAAGGLGGALMAYFGARLQGGIDRILDIIGFDKAVASADLVITGEGKSDAQTLSGKAPYGVLRRSGSVPVVLLSGRIENRDALLAAGFDKVLEASPRNLPLATLLDPSVARSNLSAAVKAIPPNRDT